MRVSHIISKVGQPKIILAEVFEQKILMWFFSLIICLTSTNWLKKKFTEQPWRCWNTQCNVAAVKIWAKWPPSWMEDGAVRWQMQSGGKMLESVLKIHYEISRWSSLLILEILVQHWFIFFFIIYLFWQYIMDIRNTLDIKYKAILPSQKVLHK